MRLTNIIIYLLVFCLMLFAGGNKKSELQWSSFDNGLAEAKKTDKKILVDVYTDWCGWCKRMDKDTYGNDSVASYLTKKFVIIKLNAESDATVHYKGKTYSELTMARGFGVNGYPTILFLEPSGKHITTLPSYLGPDKFLNVATYIAEDYYKTMTWEQFSERNENGKSKK